MTGKKSPLTAKDPDYSLPLALLRAVYSMSSADLLDLDEAQVQAYLTQAPQVSEYQTSFLAQYLIGRK